MKRTHIRVTLCYLIILKKGDSLTSDMFFEAYTK